MGIVVGAQVPVIVLSTQSIYLSTQSEHVGQNDCTSLTYDGYTGLSVRSFASQTEMGNKYWQKYRHVQCHRPLLSERRPHAAIANARRIIHKVHARCWRYYKSACSCYQHSAELERQR